MKVELTKEQAEELVEDGSADIVIGDYGIYLELNRDGSLWYMELFKKKNGKTEQGYAFDTEMLEKLMPKRPNDPSFCHNDPLCPNCGADMRGNTDE